MDEAFNDQRLLDMIRIVSAKGESGRLQINVGQTRGAFFFTRGKLVDARMGSLTGLPAVNAAVSLREAAISFDPSIPPPSSSFIALNERIVLRQLFGIETARPEASNDEKSGNEDELTLTRSRDVPLSDATNPNWRATHPQNHAQKTERENKATEQRRIVKLEGAEDLAQIKTTREAEPGAGEIPVRSEARKSLEEKEGRSIAPQETIAQTNPPPVTERAPLSYRRILCVAMFLVLVGAGTVALVLVLHERVLNQQRSTTAPKPRESSLAVTAEVGNQVEEESPETQNLTGQWKVINVVEKTSYRSFSNVEIGFRVFINQTGREFTAKGEKVSENGQLLPANARTPIHLSGSIDGQRVEATFIEQGVRRKTSGRFVWRIENAYGLTGTFVSSAARSRGTSAATKVLSG